LELATTIARVTEELTGVRPSVTHEPSPESAYLIDNPNRRCPDITKLRGLGFRPRVDLEDGLRRTLRWYAGNHGGAERRCASPSAEPATSVWTQEGVWPCT